MSHSAKILLIEDDASAAAALQCVLQDEGHTVSQIPRGDTGFS